MSVDKLRLYTDSSFLLFLLLCGRLQDPSSRLDQEKQTALPSLTLSHPTHLHPKKMQNLTHSKPDIRAVIDGLGNDREREVIFFRFGFTDGNLRTLEETRKKLGISRERVRVIENRALNKLRHSQRNHCLKDKYLDHPVANNNHAHDRCWLHK